MPRESGRAHLHVEAEVVKPGDQTFRELGFVAAIEVVGAEVAILRAVAQDVVRGGEDGGGDSDDGLLGAAAAAESKKLGAEIAALVVADGAPGGLDERGFEPAIAGANARRAALAGTLVQAWAEPRPGDEMTGRGEMAHVDADLGDEDVSGGLPDAADGGQAGEGGTKGGERVLQARLEFPHRGVEGIDLAQVQGEHEAVVRGDAAVQGLDEFGARGFEAATVGEVGESLGIGLAGDEGVEEAAAGHAEDIGEHAGELEIGELERFLDAQGMAGLFADQLRPSTSEVAQLLQRRLGDETAADEAVGEEVGDPGGVVDVGLAPRDVADVHGVGEDEFEAARQHVPDRLPVHPCGFHGDVGTPVGGEPIAQGEQLSGGGSEGLHLPGDLGPGPDAGAGDDAVLVHIQSGALGMNHVHAGLLRGVAAPAWSPRGRKLESALSGPRPVVAVRGARRAPGPTPIRALGTIARPTSVPAPAQESTAPRISCDVGPRSGWAAGLARPPAAVAPEIHRTVDGILTDVRARGDAALLDLTARFDGFTAATPMDLVITADEFETAERLLAPDIPAALSYAAERIERYHAAA